MKYCPVCEKLVNVNEEKNVWLNSSSKFWMIVGSCSICFNFLYQYLKDKNE